jgi:hypothetical protein
MKNGSITGHVSLNNDMASSPLINDMASSAKNCKLLLLQE